jgi:hypothetical protein
MQIPASFDCKERCHGGQMDLVSKNIAASGRLKYEFFAVGREEIS